VEGLRRLALRLVELLTELRMRLNAGGARLRVALWATTRFLLVAVRPLIATAISSRSVLAERVSQLGTTVPAAARRSAARAGELRSASVRPSVRGAALSTFDAAGMEERMDAIRLKQILGAPLTERELMCLQIEQNGMACHARPLRHIPLDPYPSQEVPGI